MLEPLKQYRAGVVGRGLDGLPGFVINLMKHPTSLCLVDHGVSIFLFVLKKGV